MAWMNFVSIIFLIPTWS